MTYCVAIHVDAGLVFCSDSRTNAGVDQVSTYSKMYRFCLGDDRHIVINAAGNLATTQAVMARLQRDLQEHTTVNLSTVTSVHDACDYVGELSVIAQQKHRDKLNDTTFESSFLLGGKLRGEAPLICLIYPQGNHITSSPQTPYLQIGESKYGKPILDRILRPDSTLSTAALCALLSMDSTMRSNLSVGPPVELVTFAKGSQVLTHQHFDANSDYFRSLHKTWEKQITHAFSQLEPPSGL